MSQIYASALVAILAQVLPGLGVVVGTPELTTTVSTLATIGAAVWVMIRRYKMGGVGVFGGRKR